MDQDTNYFIEPVDELAAIMADDAASMAEVAAEEAAIDADMADDDASIAGAGVTTVVVDVVAGIVGASSFLLQAAKETTATRETIRNAFFILVLYI